METIKINPLLLAGLTVLIIGSGVTKPALAADDTTSAVQALTDALTGAATGAAASAAVSDTDDAYTEDESAADQAAGLPRFKDRQERREFMRKLREENPDRFKEIKQKRREYWIKNHPEAARKFREKKGHGYGHKKGYDYRENHRDRMEDMRDRREDRWDARHEGGKWDRMEDHRDRMEDMRDRREDRWDAKHGPDRGFPGNGYGRPEKFRQTDES